MDAPDLDPAQFGENPDIDEVHADVRHHMQQARAGDRHLPALE